MKHENDTLRKQIILFLGLTITLSWIIFLVIPIKGLVYGQGVSVLLLTIAMMVPTISSLLTRFITKEGFKNMYLLPNFRGNIKKYILVYFGPTILLFVSAVIYFLILPANFDPKFLKLKSMMEANGITNVPPKNLLIIQGVQIIIIGPIINLIPTLGEEIGWRGYLLPKLRKIFSDKKALVITGIIWGLWHLPVIVIGHNYGTDYAGYPWTGILAMILFCLVMGIIEGYAMIKFNSVIPAAMIHSTINSGAALPILLSKSSSNPILGPAITGLLGNLPFVILAIILFVKMGKGEAY